MAVLGAALVIVLACNPDLLSLLPVWMRWGWTR